MNLEKYQGFNKKKPNGFLGKRLIHPWLFRTCEDQSKAISSITPCASPKAWVLGKTAKYMDIEKQKNSKNNIN